jgi:hypothetical protein
LKIPFLLGWVFFEELKIKTLLPSSFWVFLPVVLRLRFFFFTGCSSSIRWIDEFEETLQMFALQRVISPRSADCGSPAPLCGTGM